MKVVAVFLILMIFVLAIVMIALIVVDFVLPYVRTVEVNLVNANADLADGPPSYEFKVGGREIPGGHKLKVYQNFEVEIFKVEADKKTLVDKVNIGSLLEEGDLVAYAYYGEASSRGRALYIHIEHSDGIFREVLVNID